MTAVTLVVIYMNLYGQVGAKVTRWPTMQACMQAKAKVINRLGRIKKKECVK
jgi:hypothetical protein